MDLLPDVDEERAPQKNAHTRMVPAKPKVKKGFIVAVIIIALIIAVAVATYSNIAIRIEAAVRGDYEEQITTLQEQLEDSDEKHNSALNKQKETYEEKLEKQKASYEDKLADADAKHAEAIAKKDKKIKDLQVEIDYQKALRIIAFDDIQEKIEAESELTTLKYCYTYAGIYEDFKKFFDIDVGVTKKSFVAMWDGTVGLGIDMSRVKLNVNENTKTITVSVPKAEIFYHDVDFDSFKYFDVNDNIFNPLTLEDTAQFNKHYEEKIYQKIQEGDLLDQAYENAIPIIKNMLLSHPYLAEQYTIGFKQIS